MNNEIICGDKVVSTQPFAYKFEKNLTFSSSIFVATCVFTAFGIDLGLEYNS